MAEMKTLLECNDKLITALSSNPVGTAGALVAKGLITTNIEAEMLLPAIANHNKATKLAISVRDMVRPNPKNYHVFVDVLSEEPANDDIVKILDSTYQRYSKTKEPLELYCLHTLKDFVPCPLYV